MPEKMFDKSDLQWAPIALLVIALGMAFATLLRNAELDDRESQMYRCGDK